MRLLGQSLSLLTTAAVLAGAVAGPAQARADVSKIGRAHV